jgi:hypothetical protein
MRTGKRTPVLLIPGDGETKQNALDSLLAFWKQRERKRQNSSFTSSTTPTADNYWIKILTRYNYQHDLNNGKVGNWKKALSKSYGQAYIPRDLLPELKTFFKTSFDLRLQIKPITFYDKDSHESLWLFPDLQTLGMMARNHRR